MAMLGRQWNSHEHLRHNSLPHNSELNFPLLRIHSYVITKLIFNSESIFVDNQ
jgi:hypothetical protein